MNKENDIHKNVSSIYSGATDKSKVTLDINDLIKADAININLNQEVIVTTRDKIELCLFKYLKNIESRKNWIAPLGILVTVLITISTAEFKEFLAIKSPVWEALFYASGFLSFIWLVKSLYDCYKAKKIEIKDVIKDLKRSQGQV